MQIIANAWPEISYILIFTIAFLLLKIPDEKLSKFIIWISGINQFKGLLEADPQKVAEATQSFKFWVKLLAVMYSVLFIMLSACVWRLRSYSATEIIAQTAVVITVAIFGGNYFLEVIGAKKAA